MQKIDISVRELVNKVLRRELTLPEMQRGYVWRATRVRDLPEKFRNRSECAEIFVNILKTV